MSGDLENILRASLAAARAPAARLLAATELPSDEELAGVHAALDLLTSREPIAYTLTLRGREVAEAYTTEILDLIK